MITIVQPRSLWQTECAALADGIVEWIQDWFRQNGDGCKAVIGISGGKDSSVVAALCVKALGKDRVVGVLMPNVHQPDIDCSYELVKHLGIQHYTVPITSATAHLQSTILHTGIEISTQAAINLPARIRMATLYAVSQSIGGRVANTCNLSEDWIGYSTRWGDSVGDFAPIADLTCSEVIQVGEYLGLPDRLIHKVPSDGLTDHTDEEAFGFSYGVLDTYIRTGVCEDDAVRRKIDELQSKNSFKLSMPPKFQTGYKNIKGGLD